jgi:hypothetical protein
MDAPPSTALSTAPGQPDWAARATLSPGCSVMTEYLDVATDLARIIIWPSRSSTPAPATPRSAPLQRYAHPGPEENGRRRRGC